MSMPDITTRKQLLDAAQMRADMQCNSLFTCISIRRGTRRVMMYPDGTLLRADVRLDLAKPMTVHSAVQYLFSK